jgi:hypothetical protein
MENQSRYQHTLQLSSAKKVYSVEAIGKSLRTLWSQYETIASVRDLDSIFGVGCMPAACGSFRT